MPVNGTRLLVPFLSRTFFVVIFCPLAVNNSMLAFPSSGEVICSEKLPWWGLGKTIAFKLSGVGSSDTVLATAIAGLAFTESGVVTESW